MVTKKTDIAARFGSRYGLKIRRLVVSIEKQSRAKHVCPNCFKKALKRQSAGIWVCKRCGFKMAGGAYSPFTDAQKILQKMVK